jgi:mRNA interferase HigB
MLNDVVRIIAVSTIKTFWDRHPDAKISLERWVQAMRDGHWQTTGDVQLSFSKARVLNGERVRFEVAGGDYRLIASFKFKNQLVFVKFVGTHADYDRIDALTVSQF